MRFKRNHRTTEMKATRKKKQIQVRENVVHNNMRKSEKKQQQQRVGGDRVALALSTQIRNAKWHILRVRQQK